ncbi:MAG: MogA/MoaB family molybdenum cofactor biosynthesis protein [Thermoplasmata archaeon]|nr:MogA/MoaB family molybdenum cofactor biosynthesis protein [Thermoplasmata archaeon]
MGSKEHKEMAPHTVKFAIITLSDKRTEKMDESGRIAREILERAGHRMVAYHFLPNDKEKLERLLDSLVVNPEVDAVITIGGTGISTRDITVEVVASKLDKNLDGFGEIFRFLSYREIGSSAVMSRAIAGVMRSKIIVCLPGSAGAVKLAVTEILLNELGHMVWEARR